MFIPIGIYLFKQGRANFHPGGRAFSFSPGVHWATQVNRGRARYSLGLLVTGTRQSQYYVHPF